jgi:hypothetical protein
MKKTISKSENPGLAKLAKKKPELAKKFGYDPNRVTAKDGGCMQIKGFGKARRPKK